MPDDVAMDKPLSATARWLFIALFGFTASLWVFVWTHTEKGAHTEQSIITDEIVKDMDDLAGDVKDIGNTVDRIDRTVWELKWKKDHGSLGIPDGYRGPGGNSVP